MKLNFDTFKLGKWPESDRSRGSFRTQSSSRHCLPRGFQE